MTIFWKVSERKEDLEHELTVTCWPYDAEGKRVFTGHLTLPVASYLELARLPLGSTFTITIVPVVSEAHITKPEEAVGV